MMDMQKTDAQPFTIFKATDGRMRWISISSNAFRDRDGEVITLKALEEDVARKDAIGGYGPLLWFHDKRLVLGECDFNAMHGRMLIESGTFYSEGIAKAMAGAAIPLQVSIGYRIIPGERATGVYSYLDRYERSLAPADRVRNPLTAFSVQKEEPMDGAKVEQLKALLQDPMLIEQVLGTAAAMEAKALAAGVVTKAEEPAEQPEAETETTTTTVVEVVTHTETEPAEAPMEAGAAEPAMDAAAEPATEAVTAEVVKGWVRDAVSEELSKVKASLETVVKAADSAATSHQQRVADIEATLTAIKATVAELAGEQPRGVAALRASESVNTVIEDATRLKAGAPGPDKGGASVDGFLSWAVRGN